MIQFWEKKQQKVNVVKTMTFKWSVHFDLYPRGWGCEEKKKKREFCRIVDKKNTCANSTLSTDIRMYWFLLHNRLKISSVKSCSYDIDLLFKCLCSF